MDLADLKPKSDTITVKITHPVSGEPLLNDDGSQMFVEVYAQHTREYKSAVYGRANQKIKEQKQDFSFEELESLSLNLLADITVSWDLTYEGKKPKLTKAKANEIYRDIFWLKAQVEEGLNSFEVFTQD